MKAIYLLSLCLFAVSPFAQADEPEAAPHDVLATCKTSDDKPAFQIFGDLKTLAAPRMQAESVKVTLGNAANSDIFGSDIELTKSAPYYFTLAGNQMDADRTRIVRWVYGWSQGTLLTIQDTQEGQATTTYHCVLAAELLTNP